MSSYIRLRNYIAFLIAIAFALPLFAADKYWTGATSGWASTASNWCDDPELTIVSSTAPQDGDAIYLTSGSKAMTNNLDVTFASWYQDGYTGYVNFRTGKKNGVSATLNGYTDDNGETRCLKVTGDITLNTGYWRPFSQPTIGTSTAAYKSGYGVYRLIVDVGGNFTIGTGATITAKARGFGTTKGPGGVSARNCATHGGVGSYFASGYNTNCYGVISSPITIGSGGYSTSGGGAVTISCAGALTMNGTIDVSGSDSAQYHVGAGGSIYVVASSITGSGTLNANGGAGTASTHDEGGGGGRIAVKLTGAGSDFTAFTGTIKAKLGKKGGSSCLGEGSGGTIYLETAADGPKCGTLIIDGCEGGFYTSANNFNLNTKLTSSVFDVTPSKIVFRPEAKAALSLSEAYTLPTTVQETASGLNALGYLEIASAVTLREMPAMPLALKSSGVTIGLDECLGGTLEIGAGQILYVDNSSTVNGNVRVLSGGKIAHRPFISTYMNLVIEGNLTIDAGGSIDVTGYGDSSNGTTSNCGGTYGGRALNAGQCCYGSIRRPTDYGSPGKGNGNGQSKGGGAIRITARGALTINGTVAANSPNTTYRPGSGGSVWLTGRSISGSGTISANSGNQTSSNNSPGGGGRVAVWLTGAGQDFSSFTGSITAYGGKYSNGTRAGGAGTVYLKTGDQADNEGTLVIANLGAVGDYADIMVGGSAQKKSVSDFDVGNVVIKTAKLYLSGATMTVKRGWSKDSASTFTCAATGGVALDGLEDAYFYGNNTFASFVCEVPGKTLYFGTGSTNSLAIASGGTLTLTGDETTKLNLRPAVSGEEWKLTVPVSALSSYNVRYVTAEYSNASTGEEIVATDSTESTPETCTNWRFLHTEVGQVNTWLGTTSSSWQEATNWSLERAPLSTDRVIVPVAENYPVIASDTELAGLDVASCASFSLAGNNLSVTESFVFNGTLVVSGSERIDLSATNIVLAADTFVPQRSVVTIMGDENQTVSINNDLWRLNVVKGGGTISWSGSTAVESVFSVNASAASAIEFASGALISCDEFIANGDVGGVASLAFSGGSISAAKYARAKGVSVTGNNASGGVAVYVDSPFTDGGGNSNWLFGTGRFVWTGAADSVFSNDLNWAGGVAPGENDVAEISSAASITISSEVSLGGLILGGGAGTVTFTARAPLAVDDILYVGTNTTLVLDAATTAGFVYVDEGGAITHTRGASAETYKINLAVDGDMTVSEKGKVTAYGKGYSSGNGPGAGANQRYGGTYGGRGSLLQGTPPNCYGSYLNPVNYGSGGQSTTYGGGAIKLVVGGTLFAEGQINADGNGNGTSIYTSAGGSVWITCGELKGRGVITANGGNGTYSSDSGYLGAGGRVAIYKTTAGDFSDWQGTTTAYGGYNIRTANFTGTPQASSGTVVWGVTGERPSVVIENKNYVSDTSFGTDIPVAASRGGDAANLVKDYDIVVKRGGKLNLVADATIWDLSLETANASVILNGHTLTIRSRTHKNRRGWKGTVTAGGGQIIWKPGGLAITVK